MDDFPSMNPAQQKAVTWDGGPLLVLAGPGSGKTYTVTKRILYLLHRGIPPEQILVITFTKEAALSMQRRFQQSVKGFWPVHFGTFHSFFYQILKQSQLIGSGEILTFPEKIRLMLPILQKIRKETGGSLETESLKEECAAVLSAVGFYKNTLCEQEAKEKLSPEWRAHFQDICEAYGRKTALCGKPDFDDMLYGCLRFLQENREERQKWQKRFRHILIDEFQDINPVQYETIRLLAGKDTCLFAVGDDDQSIYGFRGSRPECMKRFEQEYQAQRILLDINYRSLPGIVDASLAVIGENRDRFEKELRPDPGRTETGSADSFRIRCFEDSDKEVACLIRQLEEYDRRFSQQNPPKQCAVLFRTNWEMQKLAVKLRRAGIPFWMGERMQSVYEHVISRDVTAYLSLAAGAWNGEDIQRIINKPSRLVSREMLAGCGCMEDLAGHCETSCHGADWGRETAGRVKKLIRQLQVMKDMSPGLAVAYVRKAVGYETYLRRLAGNNEEKWEEWKRLLDWLQEDASRFGNLFQWKEAQAAYTKSLEQRRESGNSGKAETGMRESRIRLMTVHGAKGLEFDTVFIPDCNEGNFPCGKFLTGPQAEEERRVFYVAMTRAKECLELFYLSGKTDGSRPPSRFLNPFLRSRQAGGDKSPWVSSADSAGTNPWS